MSTEKRLARLAHDHQRMRVLADDSTIMHVEAEGQPPNKYRIIFRGTSTSDDYLNEHEISIWLGMEYPQAPPEIRFTTHVFHPNVSRSGVVSLVHCGIDWNPKIMLDHICEKLWDLSRYAYVNLQTVANDSARQWFASQRSMSLPVDVRPLRDSPKLTWILPAPATNSGEILVIDANTPAPEPPPTDEDEDILYID